VYVCLFVCVTKTRLSFYVCVCVCQKSLIQNWVRCCTFYSQTRVCVCFFRAYTRLSHWSPSFVCVCVCVCVQVHCMFQTRQQYKTSRTSEAVAAWRASCCLPFCLQHLHRDNRSINPSYSSCSSRPYVAILTLDGRSLTSVAHINFLLEASSSTPRPKPHADIVV